MGNYKLSIDDYNKAIDIDPKLSEGYFRRGLSMFHSKRYKESIDDFNQAKDIEGSLILQGDLYEEDREWGIEDGLGNCYHALKNYNKALMHYETAIEHRPNILNFLINRAQLYYD